MSSPMMILLKREKYDRLLNCYKPYNRQAFYPLSSD